MKRPHCWPAGGHCLPVRLQGGEPVKQNTLTEQQFMAARIIVSWSITLRTEALQRGNLGVIFSLSQNCLVNWKTLHQKSHPLGFSSCHSLSYSWNKITMSLQDAETNNNIEKTMNICKYIFINIFFLSWSCIHRKYISCIWKANVRQQDYIQSEGWAWMHAVD